MRSRIVYKLNVNNNNTITQQLTHFSFERRHRFYYYFESTKWLLSATVISNSYDSSKNCVIMTSIISLLFITNYTKHADFIQNCIRTTLLIFVVGLNKWFFLQILVQKTRFGWTFFLQGNITNISLNGLSQHFSF